MYGTYNIHTCVLCDYRYFSFIDALTLTTVVSTETIILRNEDNQIYHIVNVNIQRYKKKNPCVVTLQ